MQIPLPGQRIPLLLLQSPRLDDAAGAITGASPTLDTRKPPGQAVFLHILSDASFCIVWLAVVGPSQNIIGRHLIVVCQFQKMNHRNRLKSTLIAGIHRLANP